MGSAEDREALEFAQLARFDDDSELRSAMVAQKARCVGCGQVLELGSAVLTLVHFPRGSVLAAAHIECRDGLRVLGCWAEIVPETLRLQIGEEAIVGASTAILRAYRRVYGEDSPGAWPG